MARELFVYWKVPAPQAATAIAAARAMQDALVAAHPGLQVQLYLRADDASANNADLVTVMETYAYGTADQAGVGDILQAAIAAARCPNPVGLRHVEVFDRLAR